MMRIALCDDEAMYRDNISRILEEYRNPVGEMLLVDVYTNAIDLLAAMKTIEYDGLLLDVIMPGFSGIDAAWEIRQNDMALPIIFLTSSPEFAVESYRVHAFDYLMKPINTGDLYRTLNHLYVLKKGKTKEILTIKSAKGVHTVPYEQLEFVEISNRIMYFYLLNGEVIDARAKLSDYEEVLLRQENFLKVHRSYIINMALMKSFDKKSFWAMTGEMIPISRNIVKDVQDSYMQYLHSVIHQN